jgi:hypothetical protein
MNKKRIFLKIAVALLTVLLGLIITSCGAVNYLDRGDSSAGQAYDTVYPEEYGMSVPAAEAPEFEVRRPDGGVGDSSLRYVIRNGSIDLAVRNTRDTIQTIRGIVSEVDGIVSNSYVYEIREGQYGANLTLRIPAQTFDAVMPQIENLGRATNVQTGQEDVTMHYIDLESRLKNQIAQEERLVEILEMAETVEEVLEVERELFRVRGEIESMTAQFTYLQDQVTYATINVNLREEAIPTENISPGAFENFGRRISQAFISSINFILHSISSIIIAVITILPILILLGLVVLLIVLLIRKLSKRKPDVPDKTEE